MNKKDLQIYTCIPLWEKKLRLNILIKVKAYNYTELTTNTVAIHSSLHENKNSNNEYDRPNKNKEGKSVSRIWFCVVILTLLLFILISLATSIIISFVMKSSMNIIKHKVEEIENNTQKIFAIEERELKLLYFVHHLNNQRLSNILFK